MKNVLINLVRILLENNNISFDKQELAFQIQSHPSYPSLHAITGVLNHFNIDNIAAEIPKNTETILQLPNCFIAQIEINNSKELVTVVKEKLGYSLFYSLQKKETNTALEFLNKFTGIIVAVETSSEEIKPLSDNKNYVLVSLLSILTIGLFFVSNSPIINLLFFFTSLIGLLISVAIYKQELGLNSLIGNAFCSNSDEKKDCDAVLSSKGANVFKDYKLSDFCLLYFSSITLILFFRIQKNSSIDILYLISLLVLPITLYSIYYQFKIVKKWCGLCLSIVAVLWLQASLVFFNYNFIFDFSLVSLLITAFSFLITLFVWNTIKPKLKEFQESKKLKLDYFKFKRNFNLFKGLLQKSNKINTEIENVNEIVFGNKNSKFEILIVTNPFCGHCKSVHRLLENILEKYNNKVKIIIRFNIDTTDTESNLVKITSRLLELYETEEMENCFKSMNQIYEGKSVISWLKEWEECSEKEKYVNILEQENSWCKENGINFTPEILINGYTFPKEYERSDLFYFIEDLYEDSIKIII